MPRSLMATCALVVLLHSLAVPAPSRLDAQTVVRNVTVNFPKNSVFQKLDRTRRALNLLRWGASAEATRRLSSANRLRSELSSLLATAKTYQGRTLRRSEIATINAHNARVDAAIRRVGELSIWTEKARRRRQGRDRSGKPKPMIGAAGAVRGDVWLVDENGKKRKLKLGDDVFSNDRIETGKDSRLQVLLLDETIFTVGPHSEVNLDEYVYDPFNNNGRITARISKGMIRFVSGLIARRKPSNMKIHVPGATLGPRGTDFKTYVKRQKREGEDYRDIYVHVFSGAIVFTPKQSGKQTIVSKDEVVALLPDGTKVPVLKRMKQLSEQKGYLRSLDAQFVYLNSILDQAKQGKKRAK